ncbi:MAG: gamma-glutamylcyclotransferase [Candidatus Kapabacteria bacterium]|nr:gamma-glutamylcyclotransferase [Candidatus Kapabacteria bacterium]
MIGKITIPAPLLEPVAAETTQHHVFVYGTLNGNHRLLESSELVGKATAEGIAIHAAKHSPFPFAMRNKQQTTHGEVYKINNFTLNKLDKLEGTPCFYQRETTVCTLASGEQIECWIYLSPRHAKQLPILRDGIWL